VTTCTSLAVAERFLRASIARTAVLAHVDRDGVEWGWFSNDVQRLHLVPSALEHQGTARVWLEDGRGNRSFQVDQEPSDSGLDLRALRAWVQVSRDGLEAAWLRSCSLRGWLEYKPSPATIVLYPETPQEIRRCLSTACVVCDELQIAPRANTAYLLVRLNRLIWHGAHDGSDARGDLSPSNPV
jgi:hypothetical protein